MGKGSATTTTQQQQTNTPTGAPQIQAALTQAQNAAQLPFNIPQAPVAGFSQDQQTAFGNINSAQGMAQPYINQAQQYFSPQGAQQFFNPYADAVTAQMQNIFGQQNQQNTANLTQAAGGVGADRIAVGQGNLANQQGLAAGQTYANLYGQAAQQAQSAGYGTAALGSQAQNAALQGAQAQLASGGLQQQLQQAQLNSPYQQQLAQSAFPYQQAQFLAGITGSLAPGLGGTTSGTGSTTTPPPSMLSQILGVGTAAAGAAGGAGAFGGGSGGKGGGVGSYGQASNATGYGAGTGGISFPMFARGGGIGYAEGGAPESSPFDLPPNFNDRPINVAEHSIIPTVQTPAIHPDVPKLNLTPPTPAAQSGPGVADIAKLAMMFVNRGGRVNPYARGGVAGYADGGAPDFDGRFDASFPNRGVSSADDNDPSPASFEERFPYRGASVEGYDAWHNNTPAPSAMAYAGDDRSGKAFPPPSGSHGRSLGEPVVEQPADAPQDVSARSRSPVATQQGVSAGQQDAPAGKRDRFIDSPWAALMAAGLGIAGGTSPFAAVNIGQGGMQGLKTLQTQRETSQKDETIDQATRRLDQEAKFHEDSYTRLTKAQQAQIEQAALPYEQLTKGQAAQLEETRRQHELARVPVGMQNKVDENGKVVGLQPIPGGPHDPATIRSEAEAKRPAAMSDDDMKPMIETYRAGNTAGVLTSISRGTQGAQNVSRFWHLLAEDLQKEGKSGSDLAAAKANFMAQAAGARTAAVREANIDTAVNEAKGTFPQVLRTSAALPRGTFVPFNQALEYVRTKTGSPEQRQYGAAIQAAVTAYSQAMSRTGVNSVYAQQHASDILARADGHEAIKATLGQLDTEMAIAQRAPEQTRQAILDRILGIGPAQQQGQPAATGAAPTAKTIARQGTVNSGPNAGKTVIEYSDGTREYR